ncbi:MAG: hypothetical protein ABJQ37_15355 [Reichenbachiella sp.]|uniref:hypothetical protein n=1 Tax=Reichenbachiella sp. TaxID=2184521 RepID=UPI003299ED01
MKGWKFLVWVLVILFINKSVIISLWKETPKFSIESCEEYTQTGTFAVQHQLAWEDQKHHTDYCLAYEMDKQANQSAASNKNEMADPKAYSYPEFWGKVYHRLAETDQVHMKTVFDSLDQLSKKDSLSYTAFAHAVVKMVQDIPYQYILSDDCTSDHSDHPCYGNQRYGITSPVEFLYTLKGDCDSRTVLIYAILRHFNYDPVVLISKEYRHSMLALNISAAGEYLTIAGEKYYFWETTATGWEPGIIPPGMDNKKYWDIALKHEL